MSTKKKEKIGQNTVDVHWNLQTIKKFLQTLMKTMMCDDVKELKNHIVPECVWREVAKQMKIDIESLKNVWYNRLHMQLFCPQAIYMNDIKIRLIELLHQREISDKKSINWHNIISNFDGCTEKFLYRFFHNLCKTAREKTNFKDLKDILTYLYTEHIPHLKESCDDKILPRISFKQGNLRYKDKYIEKESSMEED